LALKHHFFEAQDWCIPKSKKSERGGKRPVWLSKELKYKLKGMKVHEMGEKGVSTWEEYRKVPTGPDNAMRKAKALLELNLAKKVKDSKECFFQYVNSKTKTREKCGSHIK